VGLGAVVKVAVGSRVNVGIDVAEGSGVLVGTSVGVATERPGKAQPVSRESNSARLKIRMCFNEILLNEMIIHVIYLAKVNK